MQDTSLSCLRSTFYLCELFYAARVLQPTDRTSRNPRLLIRILLFGAFSYLPHIRIRMKFDLKSNCLSSRIYSPTFIITIRTFLVNTYPTNYFINLAYPLRLAISANCTHVLVNTSMTFTYALNSKMLSVTQTYVHLIIQFFSTSIQMYKLLMVKCIFFNKQNIVQQQQTNIYHVHIINHYND
jgi:hypothetical protein